MKSLARFLKFLLLMLLILAGFVFAANNDAPVGLWLLRDFSARPVSIWIFLAFATGAMLGLLLGYGLWRRIRMGWQLRQLQARLLHCQQELALLRERVGDDKGYKDLP
jgi:uncharacterized integral membrane protein